MNKEKLNEKILDIRRKYEKGLDITTVVRFCKELSCIVDHDKNINEIQDAFRLYKERVGSCYVFRVKCNREKYVEHANEELIHTVFCSLWDYSIRNNMNIEDE